VSIRPLAGLAASVLLLSGVLSGCGVAGTDFHPGVAAEVGDDTITVSHVDDVAGDYCVAIKSQLATDHQVLPLRYLRGGVVGQLALVSAAKQFAKKYDVEPGREYDQKVSDLKSAVAHLSPAQQDAVIEVESSSAYISGVQQAVGEQLLREQGTRRPAPSDATAAGQQAFGKWLAEQDIQIDPQFGVEIKDGQAVPTDTSLSYAAGTTARKGGADTPDQAYAASLPAAHRCG
jgi:hypothetical protein